MTHTKDSPLFTTTRDAARQVAARRTSKRYRQIAETLGRLGPSCIFEVAAALGCFDHQISGRFGEMEKLGLIRKTGDRRKKPSTGCAAEVYEITGQVT